MDKGFFIWLGQLIWEGILNAVAYLLELIPVPDFVTGAPNVFSQILTDMVFFMSPFNLRYGLSVILAALALRFLIRRLPIVG